MMLKGPLNVLILGPQGAGKTTLVDAIQRGIRVAIEPDPGVYVEDDGLVHGCAAEDAQIIIRTIQCDNAPALIVKMFKDPPISAWRVIDTAPKPAPSGKIIRVDILARSWLSEQDTFTFKRFPDCYWTDFDGRKYWQGLDKGWLAIAWMPTPDVPKDQKPEQLHAL